MLEVDGKELTNAAEKAARAYVESGGLVYAGGESIRSAAVSSGFKERFVGDVVRSYTRMGMEPHFVTGGPDSVPGFTELIEHVELWAEGEYSTNVVKDLRIAIACLARVNQVFLDRLKLSSPEAKIARGDRD